jgi:hypothetical protein
MKRIVALILATSISIMVLAGCSGNEKLVYDGMNKLYAADSLQSQSQYSIKVDINGLSEADKKAAEPYLAFINDIIIKTDYQKEKSQDGSILNQHTNGNLDLGGISVQFDVWAKEDNSSGTANSSYIVKVPSLITLAYPGEFQGKRYFVYDKNDVNKVIMENYPDKDLTIDPFTQLKGLQKEMTDYLVKNTNLLSNLGFNYIEKTGNKNENGDEYVLKLDDKQFKSVLRNLVKDLGNDSEFNGILKKFVKSYIESMSAPAAVPESGLKAIDEFLNSGELTKYANTILDAFENVQILGENGIKITYHINSDGYITDESGVIDVQFDVADLSNAFITAMTEVSGGNMGLLPLNQDEKVTVRVQVNFDSHSTNINKPIGIVQPQVTDSNSIKYADLLEQQLADQKKFEDQQKEAEARASIMQEAQAKGYSILYNNITINDNLVSYPTLALKKNNRTLLPIRKIEELAATGIDISWDSATNSITAKKGSTTIMFKPNSDTAIVNGVKKKMGVAAPSFQGRLFVPLRFFTENFGGSVFYNAYSGDTNVYIN